MNLFQKQQNSSGYDSIPKAIATDDATAAAVPFVMTLGQRSKRMVVIAAGLLLVTGGAAVWLQQEEGSYFRSSGGSLATEDGSITTDVEGLVVGYDPDPNDQSSPNDGSGCSGRGEDPFRNGKEHKVPCCEGFEQELKDWNNTGQQSYRCEPTSTPKSDPPCQATCVAKKVDEKYACGDPTYDQTQNTWVCYPTGVTGQVPVVFYNRDSNGWVKGELDAGNKKWLKKMAEQCLITIAPMTLQKHYNREKMSKQDKLQDTLCKQDHDSFLAFDFLHNNQNWSKKWGITDVTPDWTRIAAAGQSSGAHHIPRFQMLMGGVGIKMKAVLYGHGGSPDKDQTYPPHTPNKKLEVHRTDLDKCFKDLDPEGKSWCDNVPAMFLTASNDGEVNHASTYNWYLILTGQKLNVDGSKKVHVQNAVYAQVPGKPKPHNNHMEPIEQDGGAFNDYAARFLACHLYDAHSTRSLEACAWIYKTKNKTMCNSKAVEALVDTGGVNGKKGRHLFHDGNKIC